MPVLVNMEHGRRHRSAPSASSVFTPKGSRPPAQRCRIAATLGPSHRPVALPQRGCASIPHITLIPCQCVSAQQRPHLIPERCLLVMLFLFRNVPLHRLQIRLAHGKIRVPTLRREIPKLLALLLDPEIRCTLEFLPAATSRSKGRSGMRPYQRGASDTRTRDGFHSVPNIP
jgi:hypothetical protein